MAENTNNSSAFVISYAHTIVTLVSSSKDLESSPNNEGLNWISYCNKTLSSGSSSAGFAWIFTNYKPRIDNDFNL